jgi:high-affinity nickel permease
MAVFLLLAMLAGYLVVAIFVTSWLVSVTIYRIKRYDAIEVTGR